MWTNPTADIKCPRGDCAHAKCPEGEAPCRFCTCNNHATSPCRSFRYERKETSTKCENLKTSSSPTAPR